MGRLSRVQDFVNATGRALTLDTLRSQLVDMTTEMGFDHVSLQHHVNLSVERPADALLIGNYPSGFAESYIASHAFVRDPVVAASCYSSTGFLWSKINGLIQLSPEHRAMFELCRQAGLDDGYVVPVHLPGETNGACNFVMRQGRALPVDNFMMAQLIARYAFEAGRRIVRKRDRLPIPGSAPKLSARQLDCVVLAARGHTNSEIAERLAVRTDTVADYLDEARRRYGARNRTQLVLRVVFDGSVTLSDVVR